MSLCRGQFFFINNASILRTGLTKSLLQGSRASSVTGASRSATVSHYLKTVLTRRSSLRRSPARSSPAAPLKTNSVGAGAGIGAGLGKRMFSTARMFSTSRAAWLETTQAKNSLASASIAADAVERESQRAAAAERPVITGRGSKRTTDSGASSRAWPINTAKPVGYLCIFCSILVFAIVVLGGLTRLTESGLSITEWKPVTGAIPPLNQQDWEAEFAKYKNSPEFKELNADMTLDEYKFIYSMEWSHRLLGRFIGVAFVLPSLYYIARRKVSPPTALKLLGICGLLGLQGFIGWWMVYSGIDRQLLDERRSKPTVSPYRLATHLATAFTVYCAMISTGFSILRDHKVMADPEKYQKIFQQVNSPKLAKFKTLSKGLFGLVFFTAMTGALVAGLDAGLIYNTFPKMGEGYAPPKRELMDPLYARRDDQTDLWWRNMLENPTTVQFNHRIMAITTFCSIFALHMYSHRIKAAIPKTAYKCLNASMGLVTLQVALGISTLIYIVPTDIAAAHQAGALSLLTGMLLLVNNLKKPTRSNIILMNKFLEKAAKEARSKIMKP